MGAYGHSRLREMILGGATRDVLSAADHPGADGALGRVLAHAVTRAGRSARLPAMTDPQQDRHPHRRQPRHRPCHRQALHAAKAGASSPAAARTCRRSASATATGPTMSSTDLADADSVDRFIAEADRIIDGQPAPRPGQQRRGLAEDRVQGAARLPQRRRAGLARRVRAQFLHAAAACRAASPRRCIAARARSSTSPRSPATRIHPFAGSAYSTSKAALSALTREMAVEFADLGVRVNAVAPGEIETAMIGPEYETLIPRIPMHRMGRPEEVASTVYPALHRGFRLCHGDGDLRHRRPAPVLTRCLALLEFLVLRQLVGDVPPGHLASRHRCDARFRARGPDGAPPSSVPIV